MTDDEIIDAWHICSGISPGGSILELIRTLEVIFRAEERERCATEVFAVAVKKGGFPDKEIMNIIDAIRALK